MLRNLVVPKNVAQKTSINDPYISIFQSKSVQESRDYLWPTLLITATAI